MVEQWIYGSITLLFVSILYLIKEIMELKKKQNAMDSIINSTLPMIHNQLAELNNTVKLFLKQEIDTLKDIAQSNRDRNQREEDHDKNHGH